MCIRDSLPTEKIPPPIRIGGTKNPALKKILQLRPGLIIANKEENELKDVEILAQAGCKVWVTEINDLHDNIHFYESLRRLFRPVITTAPDDWSVLTDFSFPTHGTAAYLIWQEPYMVAGGGTFIDQMMKLAGFDNIFANSPRYPIAEMSQLQECRPEHLLLSSEPYPFSQKHLKYFKQELPDTNCQLVDGQMFSWYGIRPLKALPYFRSL